MNQGLLPRRYAKALQKFSAEKNVEDEMYTFMQNIASAMAARPDLCRAVSNPFVDNAKKTGLIVAAATDSANVDAADNTAVGVLRDFVALLIKNHRIDMMQQMALAYRQMYRRQHNIHRVEIQSAAPLDNTAKERINQLIAPQLDGGTAETEYNVNPDLLGGFIVTVDNRRLDASLRNELQALGRTFSA